ncbi:RNA polymerase sigma factor [Flavilitoribacter nigricans]|uniref:Sigma factor, ECF subfamily protein n=1 Tax=Flavilitoribacter nigricans (strain ATCC 23147 / DSM 23189 / NBRC 102662 / NCIMB 1420 / SS-2) TaxID=1122177 RepID=A0A2D0NEU7_FLAN2|nr:sigma-70 family RNA polymerase sigma factor [Flavilitoribacter nigricans]PHN06928.1 sigma factor, ECF subfamily protein [Flavilitoribacter nigricans DSM 23189 = NBRC 102662]
MEHKIVDHLFRHQYGKMIAVLTNIFGLSHLEVIEDAVQDTFVKATLQWRSERPENPEAWLMKAAKNRAIDLLRKIKAEKNRFEKVTTGSAGIQLNELFLEHEIADNQLRMIFVACHPELSLEEQIAFALKTVSGFSMKEIAAALLLKEETIKKRLIRARKKIREQQIQFSFPAAPAVQSRLSGVLRVIYLIFNEGFHSTKKEQLVDQELCGEALRLCKLLLTREAFRSGSSYALFALLCFHSARLESKTNADKEIVDLEHQDRSRWYFPLVVLGNDAMNRAMEYPDLSTYHYEASIAAEHLKARSFADTNWPAILNLYEQLHTFHPSDSNLLNMAIVQLRMDQARAARALLDAIDVQQLEQRAYLFHGCYADYHLSQGDRERAIASLRKAIELTNNALEEKYLIRKLERL